MFVKNSVNAAQYTLACSIGVSGTQQRTVLCEVVLCVEYQWWIPRKSSLFINCVELETEHMYKVLDTETRNSRCEAEQSPF